MKIEIENKINALRREYPYLQTRNSEYIFNALAVQTLFYKNPSNALEQSDLQRIIVDGSCDGGIDCILTDLDSDYMDMVFIQCKYSENYTLEKIKAALNKTWSAYLQLARKEWSYYREELVEQYNSCLDEMENDAKIKFVLFLASPQNGIQMRSINNFFKTLIGDDTTNIQLEVYFEKDVVEKVIEYDSLRRTVSAGDITIDEANNYLSYSENNDDYENAVIVNGSALSIKKLYNQHHLALFSQNLRFFVKSKDIDKDIRNSIEEYKKKFWYKNNGITIVCDRFDISGKQVHLVNFSIVNGGQTTTLLGMNDGINEHNNFYLPIKIIETQGSTQDEKQEFLFEIAKATNSQKPIKKQDLKANEPEQIQFANEIRQKGVFYRTKRGEKTPSGYNEKTKNLDLTKACKLALAGIFLMPGTARSKPSIIYDDNSSYYEGIFDRNNRDRSTSSIKDLLFIDVYFDTKFKKAYKENTRNNQRVAFANVSRTLCLAYAGFLAKWLNGDISEEQIRTICNANYDNDRDVKTVQRILSDASRMKGIFNRNAYDNLDELEEKLYKIFSFVCKKGAEEYTVISQSETIDESSMLKKDSSFYRILARSIDDLTEDVQDHPERYSIFKK